MSKRGASFSSPATIPAKLAKGDSIWNSIPGDNEKKEFKPVEGGPKTKVQKSFILNYNPRVDVSISLNGCLPEVRVATSEGCFYMTGDEFLTIAGQGGGQVLDKVKLEQTGDGYRLARYLSAESGLPDVEPDSSLALNMYAVKRLKSKLEPMCDHVSTLQESEPVIRLMFDCIADVYRQEHKLSGSSSFFILEDFSDLSRLVETYVPAVVIVKAFLDHMFEKRLISF